MRSVEIRSGKRGTALVVSTPLLGLLVPDLESACPMARGMGPGRCEHWVNIVTTAIDIVNVVFSVAAGRGNRVPPASRAESHIEVVNALNLGPSGGVDNPCSH